MASEQTEPEVAGTRRRSRLARTCAFVSLAYVVWYIADLVVLDASAPTYNDLHRLYGRIGMRVLWCVVLAALLFHALHGLRVALTDLVPRLASRDVWLRAMVGFVTFALALPGSLWILWPSIRTWFS